MRDRLLARERHDVGRAQQHRLGERTDRAREQGFEIDGGLQLATQLAQHVPVVGRILEKHAVEQLFESGDGRLEQRQCHDQEHRLEHARVHARGRAQHLVEARHHDQVEPDQRRRDQRVQDAAARKQLGVEELVAHDRVGDRARAERERQDGQPGAQPLADAPVEQRRNRGREAVEPQAGGQPDRDDAQLLLEARHVGAPVAVEQQHDRGEPESQVDQREQRLMHHQEQPDEHRADVQHRGRVVKQAGGRADAEIGLPHRQRQDHHEMEHVGREHQGAEAGGPDAPRQELRAPREGALLGKRAREQEQRGKEELPHVSHVLERARLGAAGGGEPSGAGGQKRQRGEHRAQPTEEQHQRHDPIEAVARVLAQNDEAEQEDEPAQRQVQRREHEKSVHPPPAPRVSRSCGVSVPGVLLTLRSGARIGSGRRGKEAAGNGWSD